ncbi:MAG: Unknown protein [uncultured Sulfurovum sp.]|uniref:LysM domain-containing protein n=1 Tax=uncultured Sulfurovum sp. TaxID=269237 RepID=A0A6S6RUH4_9BACT|nr:MAG: Unknown protein [uncultured Sulfurovum sp.]
MKNTLVLLLLSSIYLVASNSSINMEDTISKEKQMAIHLQKILKNVKTYKNNNINKTKKLLDELDMMKKELLEVNRQLELKDQKLSKTQKELLKVQNKVNKKLKLKDQKLAKTQKELLKIQKNITRKEVQHKQELESVKALQKIKKVEIPQEVLIHKVINVQKELPRVPWVEVTVENDINIYDLALKYYGDSQQYEKIYTANQNMISQDYQISNGMSLIIPITDTFEEQPMFINKH